MPDRGIKSLSWSEPSFFKRNDRQYAWPPRYAHRVFGTTAIIFLLLPIVFPPKEGLPGAVGIFAIGATIGALGGYGISALDLILPAEVHVTSRGINRIDSFLIVVVPLLANRGYRVFDWTWEPISSGTLEKASDDRLNYILSVFDQDKLLVGRLGVPKNIDTEKLQTFFERFETELIATKMPQNK